MGINGKALTFVDTGTIFLTSLGTLNTTHQLLYFTAYDKSRYDGNPLFTTNTVISINASNFKLDYLNLYASLFYMEKVNNLNRTVSLFFRSYGMSSPFYSLYLNQTLDIGFSELGYFRFDGNFNNYQLILKTPI